MSKGLKRCLSKNFFEVEVYAKNKVIMLMYTTKKNLVFKFKKFLTKVINS